MVNKKGGKKHKRGKKITETNTRLENIPEADSKLSQDYALVLKKLGGEYLQVLTNSGDKLTAHIPGKFRKRVWINVGDVLIISRRGYQPTRCDVAFKYNEDQAKVLKNKGCFSFVNTDEEQTKNTMVFFGEDEDEGENKDDDDTYIDVDKDNNDKCEGKENKEDEEDEEGEEDEEDAEDEEDEEGEEDEENEEAIDVGDKKDSLINIDEI